MEALAAGSVILIPIPFPDLSKPARRRVCAESNLGLRVGRDVPGAPMGMRGGSGGPTLPDNTSG